MNNNQKTITFFHRKPRQGEFSIETLFKEIREEVSKEYKIVHYEAKHHSNGFFKRLWIALDFKKNQGDVNHITGDINFSNIFLKTDNTVSTIHDINRLKEVSTLQRFILSLFWIKIPIKKSRYVTTISKASKSEILKYTNCDPDKIKVIPNQKKAIFQAYPKAFNKKKPVILQVGTKTNKNIERLAEALKGINCELHIIGSLSEEQLKTLDKNNIEFKNFVNLTELEVLERYKACDILAFISTYEGFGMPIIEANAVGRPVVTSNISSMPEVAGDAALMVDPYNITEIKNAFLKIINDEECRKELINKGYQNAKRFELKSIVQQYINLYDDILK